MRAAKVDASVHLGASPDRVWPFIADTDRTNRALGQEAVEYEPIDDEAPSSARFVASTRAAGMSLRYEEMPFEWTEGQRLRVVRKMRGTVVAGYELEWTLAPSEKKTGGTKVSVSLAIEPRTAALKPVAWVQAKSQVGRLVDFVKSIDAHLSEGKESPFATDAGVVHASALGAAIRDVTKGGVRESLAKKLGEHVRTAPDVDLVRVRPFELADAWKEDRREVLRALLASVPAGMFELKWAIVCPSCLTASEISSSLSEMKKDGHCQLCDIRFELELDRAVEATFTPHGSVRAVDQRMFCMGGPARTPHVYSQTNVEPGQVSALEAPADVGRYRVFARGGASASVEVEVGAMKQVPVIVGDEGVTPAEVHVAPGGSIVVTNETTHARHVKLERLGYASAAATAHYVSTLDDFRRLFSRELLKEGTALRVARVAIFFSDLTGSTALYAKVGDAAAFRLVDDHFDVIRPAISANGGTIVKTMGDAVMAAFGDVDSAVRAAVDALRAFEAFREAHPHGAHVGLKIGAYAGACYVVTANGQLDYFGQTVNVASRVQHLAGSGEIVVGRDAFESLGAEIKRGVVEVERLSASVKGVDAPLDLVRLRLS